MRARLVDQVHVVDARGAGRHAGEAGEATVEVLHRRFRRGLAALQHVLDEVDAAARGIELVAQQHIGGAGGGAEAAMHAFAQDGVGFRDARCCKLFGGEGGLHQMPRYMRPGLRMWCGSKDSLTRADSAASAAACGWNTSVAARTASGARSSVAWPCEEHPPHQRRRGVRRGRHLEPDEPARPVDRGSGCRAGPAACG